MVCLFVILKRNYFKNIYFYFQIFNLIKNVLVIIVTNIFNFSYTMSTFKKEIIVEILKIIIKFSFFYFFTGMYLNIVYFFYMLTKYYPWKILYFYYFQHVYFCHHRHHRRHHYHNICWLLE